MILLINNLCLNSFSENRVLLLHKHKLSRVSSALITTHLDAQGSRSALISSPLQIWFESPRQLMSALIPGALKTCLLTFRVVRHFMKCTMEKGYLRVYMLNIGFDSLNSSFNFLNFPL